MLNSVFLHHARQHGRTGDRPRGKIRPLYQIDEKHRQVAEDLVSTGAVERPATRADRPLRASPRKKARKPASNRGALKERIIRGERPGIDQDLQLALATHPPLAIINDILLDGMKVVGELFASGEMQLPFVLQSAETMKAAVAFLEPHMEKLAGESKGRIILATVRGDVHDIGKNLVDIILSNNGYTVVNLGIKRRSHHARRGARTSLTPSGCRGCWSSRRS